MNQVFILTSPTNSGKSTFLSQLIQALQLEGLRMGGFIADKGFGENNDLLYHLRDILSGRSMVLASGVPAEGWTKTGNFYFNPQAVAFGNELLTGLHNGDTDLVAIDEIGPFELAGKMWAGAISYLLTATNLPMIWIVRSGLVEPVLGKWHIQEPVILDIKVANVPQTVKQILSKLDVNH